MTRDIFDDIPDMRVGALVKVDAEHPDHLAPWTSGEYIVDYGWGGWNEIVDRRGSGHSMEVKVRDLKSGKIIKNDGHDHTEWFGVGKLLALTQQGVFEQVRAGGCDCGAEYVYHDKQEEWVCPDCELE